MTHLSRFRSWLHSTLHRSQTERDMDAELRFHLETYSDDLIGNGIPWDEAFRRAHLEFGGLERAKEECRDARGITFLESLFQDIRYALRTLLNSPAFTAIAILTLALGIGANTAIFSLIDTVVLRMLPVRNPQELVQLSHLDPALGGQGDFYFTNAIWEQVRNHRDDLFSSALAWSTDRFDLAQGGAVQNANGIFVSGDFFNVLGVRPAAGRLLTVADDQRGCPGLAAISYGFWHDHFGGSPNAIGSTLSLNHHPFQIVGVSSPGFYGLDVGSKFDVAIPICTATLFDGEHSRIGARSWWWLAIMGRVKPGVTPQQLKARLAVFSPTVFAGAVPNDWDPEDQEKFRNWSLLSWPAATGMSELRRQFDQPLNILMAVVGLVLLIACANIASLMFARTVSRSKEIAVRKALGASRLRLIRQLLTECLLLSSAGALLGFLFARWGTALLVRYLSTAGKNVFLDLSLDGRILAFTAAIAVFTGILFGVLPAFRSTGVSLTAAMKGSQAEQTDHGSRFRPGKWIVGSQVALSLVLLVVAGLFLHRMLKLAILDIGFDRNNVLLVNSDLKSACVPPAQWLAVEDEMETRLRSIPGVVSVGRSVRTPVSNFEWDQHLLVDSPNAPKGDDADAFLNFVSPGYFPTLRTPLLEGRNFGATDTKTSAFVAIVNETLARKFFSGTNPVGKYFRRDEGPGKTTPLIQVVGLAKDSKYESLREKPVSQAFFPAAQIPEDEQFVNFEIRTDKRPSALISLVQDSVAQVNKSIPLDFSSLAQQVDDSLVQERLLATLSAFFGALALLLAMVGLYGALSYLVAQRRTEFGIRLALGAPPVSILRLVLSDVVIVLVAGGLTGIAISLAAIGLLQKLLFGLTPHDPATMLTSVAIMAAVASLAAYLPAHRAMRVDPMQALRYE
jgi:putative ABC transport system permease protein